MRTFRVSVTIAFIAVAAFADISAAHDQSFSYVDVKIAPGSGSVRLSVHRKDAAAALGLASQDSLATSDGIERHAAELTGTLGRRLVIEADGHVAPIRWTAAALRAERRAAELDGQVEWRHVPGRIAVTARMFPDNPLHETFVNVYEGEKLVRQEVLTDTKPSVTLYSSGADGIWAVFATFVLAGVHHIFIGPDHILFVIGLLLLGGGLGRILKITSGFTVAHSITLALATLGIFQPPARIVEPLIALSIVYVGLDNLRHRARPGGPTARDGRVPVAFAFGLVHGFGFASVLREFGLPQAALGTSLFAFNVGVELGQACIVLAALPLLALVRRQWPRIAPHVIGYASWGVVCAGGFWFVQRVFLGG